jgi:uncharacterized protein (TIGR02453 family)
LNTAFTGFSQQTFRFLTELKQNNTRDWFEIHRDEFTQVLQVPFQKLVMALTPAMLDLDPQIEIKEPKKMISRIYRDLRFSKDKSPYRPNMWASFHRVTEDWKTEPGFFVELMHDQYRYGMGLSVPTKAFLKTLRHQVETEPHEFEEMNLLLNKSNFKLMGEEYTRRLVPQTEISPELMSWYQKKSEMYVMVSYPIDQIVYSDALISKIIADFNALQPLYQFFWKIKRNSEQISE